MHLKSPREPIVCWQALISARTSGGWWRQSAAAGELWHGDKAVGWPTYLRLVPTRFPSLHGVVRPGPAQCLTWVSCIANASLNLGVHSRMRLRLRLRPLRPELAAMLGVSLSSQLDRCVAGSCGWRL
jgi:hypothetical protein